VEQDPLEILESVKECIEKAIENLGALRIDRRLIRGELCYWPMYLKVCTESN